MCKPPLDLEDEKGRRNGRRIPVPAAAEPTHLESDQENQRSVTPTWESARQPPDSVGPEQTSRASFGVDVEPPSKGRDDPVNAGSVAAGISKDSFRKGVGRDSERTVGLLKCLPGPETSIETMFSMVSIRSFR